jgi:hypothetical protein
MLGTVIARSTSDEAIQMCLEDRHGRWRALAMTTGDSAPGFVGVEKRR